MRHTLRLLLPLLVFGLLLQGCEDDPILEPTGEDETDGGSYGNVSPVASPNASGAGSHNPTVF